MTERSSLNDICATLKTSTFLYRHVAMKGTLVHLGAEPASQAAGRVEQFMLRAGEGWARSAWDGFVSGELRSHRDEVWCGAGHRCRWRWTGRVGGDLLQREGDVLLQEGV